ncbi:MAG: hypothetical protein IT382_08770 [Deltaproteobacteria bacterium]|nr:hypothetical protein [Deltaproteobacteria bacterium]
MRIRTVLSVSLVALALAACGAPPPDAGNAYASEAALNGITELIDPSTPSHVVVVSEDPTDRGCAVDSLRFDHCVQVRTTQRDANLPENVCELRVSGGRTFLTDCGSNAISESQIDEFAEVPLHCP